MAVHSEVGFVHLHVHSSFSLLESALPIAKLAKLAAADKMPALALTDTNNLFGALEFSEKMKSVGVQPIIGIQMAVNFADREANRHRPGAEPEGRGYLVLLASNEAGYRNLMRLSSCGFLLSDPALGIDVGFDRLAEHHDGLIALSGGPGGCLDPMLIAGQKDVAVSRLKRLKALFDNRFYLELQRHGLEDERIAEYGLLELADDHRLPLVATNQAVFGTRDDHESHDALLAIADGRILADSERRQRTLEHGFKTRAEMVALFKDIPEATVNTVEIAMRCAFRARTRGPILPRFAAGENDEASELRRQAVEGLERRIAVHGIAPDTTVETYRERLDFELSVIERMKYPGYFLIVADFIQYAKSQKIPVGPGRGSGAGSLVAYALTITDLDPLRFGLLFERFLNPDRVSMPDFDIDFCQERRGEVIDYVRHKYGADRVAQIITFGSLQARGVLRDVGRVLEMPYGQVDKLTKLVPQNPANPVTLQKAIAEEAKLREEAEKDPTVDRLLTIAQKLEGLYRHASTHAAGIVISDRPLDELVPLYLDPKSDMPATQFNMKWVEPAGLVKFDFLGLKTLTVLQTAVDLVRRRGVDLDLSTIPLDDKKSYDMLSRAEAVGVFQVESSGMRRALLEMKPDRLEDIIALVALYRPGPMANIPVYCARKHGLEKPEYPHPKLEQILAETFGVIVYQEQVMQIAQVLAGYSLGEADLLRRAMGKKIKSEMDAQRSRFVDGAVADGVPKGKANEIFDLLAKFADYGFNKSHAAAYALVAYQTAYMKANFPVEFMAASMTLDVGNTDKLVEFMSEAKRMGIRVEPPSVNRSGVTFEVADGAIFYALSALKGMGEDAAREIVRARESGPFKDISDFARRINPKQLSKRGIEALVASGAFDGFGVERAAAFKGADLIIGVAQAAERDRAGGQAQLFGGVSNDAIRLPTSEHWSLGDRLQREFEAVGFFLTGHPLDEFTEVLERLSVRDFGKFSQSVRDGATAGRLAATVIGRQERRTKSGSKMGIVTLSDRSGQYEAIVFNETLQELRDLLEPGEALLLSVAASFENDEVRVRIQGAETLASAMRRVQKGFRIVIRGEQTLDMISRRLDRRGDAEVSLVLQVEDATEVEIRLPGKYAISPESIGALKAAPGIVAVHSL
ncbi:MAG: DNA polymerase III subunit alpha [Beijerinckiaceae bacterium]|nr:DNA polymerase III subunit alpha [Beijerinckiaceae bacterium]